MDSASAESRSCHSGSCFYLRRQSFALELKLLFRANRSGHRSNDQYSGLRETRGARQVGPQLRKLGAVNLFCAPGGLRHHQARGFVRQSRGPKFSREFFEIASRKTEPQSRRPAVRRRNPKRNVSPPRRDC